MNHVFIGRQAIFDRSLRVHAHELLFRAAASPCAGLLDNSAATASVIVNAFIEFDVERIIGPHRAFINVDREFLLDMRPVPLPPARVVLEILEHTQVDDDVVAAVHGLRAAGFGIALDDFAFDPSWAPLLDVADIVKVDVQAQPMSELHRLLETLHGRSIALLAEKVETLEEYDTLRDLGFQYFQGYFLQRPVVIHGRQVPVGRIQTVRLVAELSRTDPDMTTVEGLVRQDPSLTYKLLRSVNSAMFGLPQRVDSVRRAIMLLGIGAIARWASMLAMGSLSDRPSEILQVALTRARSCELLARAAGAHAPDSYFTVGLLSTLDALLEMDMSQALANLPLNDDVVEAILHRRGPRGEALACAIACERWDLDACRFGTLGVASINAAYAEALMWSMDASTCGAIAA